MRFSCCSEPPPLIMITSFSSDWLVEEQSCLPALRMVHTGRYAGLFIMRWVVTTNWLHLPVCTHYMRTPAVVNQVVWSAVPAAQSHNIVNYTMILSGVSGHRCQTQNVYRPVCTRLYWFSVIWFFCLVTLHWLLELVCLQVDCIVVNGLAAESCCLDMYYYTVGNVRNCGWYSEL